MFRVSHTGFRSVRLLHPPQHAYRGSSPTNKRRGEVRTMSPTLAAAMGLSPIRLELEPDAYLGVPCWNSREQYMDSLDVAMAARLPSVLPQLDKPVSKRTLRAVAAAMASYVAHRSGRNCRATNAQLGRRAEVGERTVTRARKALKLLGVATEVMRGRPRTYEERMASWRVGDKSRGWASVWALHPCKSDVVATQPRRGRLLYTPDSESHSLGQSGRAANLNGHASRDRNPLRKRPARPTVDVGGAKLAAEWLRDARSPRFAHSRTPAAWAPVLKRAAAAGWTARDLNQLIREWVTVTGQWVHRSPDNPQKLLATILKSHGDYDSPPARQDIEREQEELAARDRRIAQQLADRAQYAAGTWADAGGPDRTNWKKFKR